MTSNRSEHSAENLIGWAYSLCFTQEENHHVPKASLGLGEHNSSYLPLLTPQDRNNNGGSGSNKLVEWGGTWFGEEDYLCKKHSLVKSTLALVWGPCRNKIPNTKQLK